MKQGSDSSIFSRRRILQTVGGALTAGLAGCSTNSNGNSGSTPTETEEPTPTPTTTPEPEAEHADVTEMAHNWARETDEDNEMIFDTYSPQQFTEELDTPEQPNGLREVYKKALPVFERLPYKREEVPESYRQQILGDTRHVVKVDQLPGGVSSEDVAGALKEEGYEQKESVNGFDVYFSPLNGSVHALGDERHVYTFGMVENQTTEVLRNSLQETLEQYNTEVFSEDMVAAEEALDVKDTYGFLIDESVEYISGLKDELQPSLGATTLGFDQGSKQSAWVFDRSKDAALVQNYLENGNIGNGYETVNREGEIVTALGHANTAKQDIEYGEPVAGMPKI